MTKTTATTTLRHLAALRAHQSRRAVAILNGNHDEKLVAQFVRLSNEAAKIARKLNA